MRRPKIGANACSDNTLDTDKDSYAVNNLALKVIENVRFFFFPFFRQHSDQKWIPY